ncbi:hypothetical protein BcabD6B2_58750 (apicoplast) [Babesia caballi]|uniref:Small ribosomal subunit protein uS3 C-terminal domain-containing protein n=1 Tax=Babesia caballi TaxID=5871 RepID=A0AAV4M393_BABCB|nr:hypothetical protein BcabD6B2_58750 [Babesia caballi]
MTKSISPIIFRYNIFSNYINKAHIKLNKNLNYINYFKFFQLLLNIIYLYKNKVSTSDIKNKFLYFKCSNIDFYNICIDITCSKIKNRKDILYNYNILHNLTNYINYFITYNLYTYNKLFVWLFITYTKNLYNNKFYIIKYIKYYLLKYSKYYIKIVKFCNKILRNNMKSVYNIRSIKLIYSGCLKKGGNKKKTFNYTKGNIPISSIKSNIDYISDYVSTHKGVIGIKCWLVFF